MDNLFTSKYEELRLQLGRLKELPLGDNRVLEVLIRTQISLIAFYHSQDIEDMDTQFFKSFQNIRNEVQLCLQLIAEYNREVDRKYKRRKDSAVTIEGLNSTVYKLFHITKKYVKAEDMLKWRIDLNEAINELSVAETNEKA